jgi:integrase
MGENEPIEGITGRLVEDYHSHLLAVKKSAQYKRDIFASFKQFVRWAWGRELIDLPRNLGSKDFEFHVAPKKIKLFEVGELTVLLNAATDRTKLYLLLMLNCGMQQKDISDLRHDEVDWKLGRVIRKRSKTKKEENVPEVDYLLWPDTFRLLKAFRSKDPHLVLVTHKGNPLKQETLVARKVRKSDNIVSTYRRLVRDQLKIPKSKRKPLKLIRKTSSSMLESNPLFARYVDYFLGHSPQTIAQRHYAAPSKEEFDKAVCWLGGQYGLFSAPK